MFKRNIFIAVFVLYPVLVEVDLMKKLLITIIIVLIVLTFGCTIGQSKTPEDFFKTNFSQAWNVEVKENTVPNNWDGLTQCKLITITNPSEEYEIQFFPGSCPASDNPTAQCSGNTTITYSPKQNYWFCPKDWNGTESLSKPVNLPARFLCESNAFKILYSSNDQNSSMKAFYEKVNTNFCETW